MSAPYNRSDVVEHKVDPEIRYIKGFDDPIEVSVGLEKMFLEENEDALLEEQAQTSEFRSLSAEGCCMPQ